MENLTDNDRHWGPLTYGPVSHEWSSFTLYVSSGVEEDLPSSHITLYVPKWAFRLKLPFTIKPHIERIYPDPINWPPSTVARLGRHWYDDIDETRYGFSVSKDGFVQIYHGRHTMDSATDKTYSMFLPWTQWKFYRFSMYDKDGNHAYTQIDSPRDRNQYDEQNRMKKACSTRSFSFKDFDGEIVTCKTQIHEREWRFGTGSFSWLRFFRKNLVRRSLELEFSKEIGPRKGSWKGGITGHSIDMSKIDTHLGAFFLYCSQNNMTFIEEVTLDT